MIFMGDLQLISDVISDKNYENFISKTREFLLGNQGEIRNRYMAGHV